MLRSTTGDRLAARVGLTFFDLIVFAVIALLLTTIGLTVAFGMRAQVARVAYMQRGDDDVYQIWLANPEEPDSARKLTDTEYGVLDFDVSDDGDQIAYSHRDFETGVSEIHLIDLRTGRTQQVTSCVTQDADCYAPKFRPGGNVIAYERASMNSELSGVGIGAPRIWLLDLNQEPPTTFPLIEDTQVLGTAAFWSANGARIAFYDNNAGGIQVYDLTRQDDPFNLVETRMGGGFGSLSPDGTQLIYPGLVQNRGHMQLANLEQGVTQPITAPDGRFDEQHSAWSPDGRYVAVGRRDLADQDMRGTQVYLLDTQTMRYTPLLVDKQYNHSAFEWSRDGSKLTMTRFQQLDDQGNVYSDGQLEVWTYDMQTGRLQQVASGALSPHWVAP